MSGSPRAQRRWIAPLAALTVLLVLGWWGWRAWQAPVAPSTPTAPEASVADLYWVQQVEPRSMGLVAVPHTLPPGGIGEWARAWVELLAAGPSDAERARGVGSEIPAATRLLGARLEAGTLTVELSEAVVAGGGSASMWGRIQQLRYSLTALPGVSSLVVEVAGAPLRVWGGEGVMVEWPWQAAGVPAASVRW